MDEQSIFLEALQKGTAKDRANYLEEACCGDMALRAQVDELLVAHDQVGNFLRKEAQLDPTADRNGDGLSGTSIGPYKLREPLGAGGFGVVWAAEQTEPVQRKVAVKIIKPGMETRNTIARFEAERQALAMMDHENIARVIDAGTTESGHPFFVMELIRGVPITDYCDTNKLTVHERLSLFSQVCRAVQHAHQKGIIHRDIKPSNVLVTLHDGRPVPKVIDFGISKALNQRLTDKTIYTRVHQAIGTLAYMSPEQAELSGLDVDTRADVYGLGVLAYELLTGTTPFDSQRLNEAALHEACRIIREEEPPRASIKVSSLGAIATAVSEQRRTRPQDLAQKLHVDLDWILVKALEKDRTRRYESASALAADVDRYLNNEAIEARPPTVAYRVRKFVSRHQGGLAVSGFVLIGLVAALVTVTSFAINQSKLLQALRQESVKRAIVAALIGDTESAEEGLSVAGAAGDRNTEIMTLEGLIALNKGDYDGAIERAKEILEIDTDHIGGLAILVYAQIWQGDIDESVMQSIRLAEVEPKGELEHLLIAYGLVLYDSDTAMKWLSKVPRIQGSPVGLLVRAQDNLFHGEDVGEYDLFLKAIQDIEYAHDMMPGSSGAEAWHATTIAHTIEFARNNGLECEELKRKGQEMLESMPESGPSPFNDVARWKLCRALDKPNEAWYSIRRAGSNAVYCWDLAVECLMRHESSEGAERAYTEVLPEYSQENKYRQIALAFLVHDGEHGAERVRGLVKEYADDPSSLVRMLASFALCLAGDLDDVEAFARRGSHHPDRGTPRFANDECLSFLANPNSAAAREKLLEAAASNSYAHINAYMTIAMTCLAKNDRIKAKKNLEKCTSRTAMGNFSYEMARALLYRMDADSN